MLDYETAKAALQFLGVGIAICVFAIAYAGVCERIGDLLYPDDEDEARITSNFMVLVIPASCLVLWVVVSFLYGWARS